ncbi:MAG: Zn-binding domain-containing protein, partial [Thermodesulfobacteriota bacterium]
YRINHGWRSRREEGFLIDLATGWWLRARDEEEVVEEPPVSPSVQRERVRLFVHDTRNILLISFLEPAWQNNEDFAATLQYALQRGIETTFQVEESELTSERIGAGEGRAVLFWEAAEGGVGVLRRLVEERDAFSQVAGAAIERCHFAPDTEKDGSCSRACYECLLSYTNQPDHQRLDRYLVREALMALSRSTTHLKSAGRPYEEHYRWLRSLTDSRSELERRLVDHLYRTKRRLPDDAQRKLADYQAIPDFFYEPNVCVFCDGVVHDEPPQREKDRVVRQELKELGYRVIAIRYDEDLEGQIHRYPDVFGEGG